MASKLDWAFAWLSDVGTRYFLLIWSPMLVAASPGDICSQGFRLAQSGDFAAARVEVRKCLKLHPNLPRVKSLAAEIESSIGLELAANGRFTEAADHFREVTRFLPDFPGGHYNLGLALLNLGDAAGAEEHFRHLLKIDPANGKARIQMANALLSQARTERSRMAEAVEALKQAVRYSPADPDLHFNLAYALSKVTDDSGALAEYREVLRLQPDYPGAEASIGYTLFRLANWDEAEKHFRAALAQGHDDFALRYYLGSTLARTGSTEEAREHLERAVRLDPEQPSPHFQLAAIYRRSGDNRAAPEEALFRELSVRQEAKWRAEALETAAKTALKQGNLVQGITALTARFQSHPDAAGARNLALAYLQNGNLGEARRLLRKALEISPKDAASYNYLGLLEAREANLPVARQHFEAALSLDPENAEAAYNAGLAALESGDVKTAVRRLESALTRSDTPRMHQALAIALARDGRHQDAVKHFAAAQDQH